MNRRTAQRLGGLALLVVVALLTLWLQDTGSDGSDPGAGDPGRTAGAAPSSYPSGSPTGADDTTDTETGLPWIDEADLPDEALEVLAAIDAGGPFRYPRNDGVVFSNREGLLPQEPRGWYREYTVRTPGEDDRGPRRIVTGRGPPLLYFFTDDHYDSFTRIRR